MPNTIPISSLPPGWMVINGDSSAMALQASSVRAVRYQDGIVTVYLGGDTTVSFDGTPDGFFTSYKTALGQLEKA